MWGAVAEFICILFLCSTLSWLMTVQIPLAASPPVTSITRITTISLSDYPLQTASITDLAQRNLAYTRL